MFSYHIPLENGRRLASHDEYSNAQHIPSYPILALDADSTDLHLSTSPRLLTPTQHAAAHPPSNFSSTVHRPDTQITYPYPYFDSTFHVSQTPTGTQFIDGISGSNIYASEYETFPQSFSTEENSLLQPAPSFGGLSDRPSLQADFFVEDYCRITYPPPENSMYV
jgi:hypothetical protein